MVKIGTLYKKYKKQLISITIFNGEKGYNLNIQNSYKDKDGNFQNVDFNLFPNQALIVADLINAIKVNEPDIFQGRQKDITIEDYSE